jgi:ATP-dependent Zn protease
MPVKAIAEDVDVTSLASATAGYTGADLTSLVNVAVVNALDHTSVVDGEASCC